MVGNLTYIGKENLKQWVQGRSRKRRFTFKVQRKHDMGKESSFFCEFVVHIQQYLWTQSQMFIEQC